MPLRFLPPLNDEEQAIFQSLPKLNGAVVHPEYWPKQERARGEKEFLAWCEKHPRSQWPQWLNDWEIRYQLAAKVRQRSIDSRVRANAEGAEVGG